MPARPSRSVTAASAASTVKVSGRPDHVQVVDLAVLLAQPQPLGEEQEVELGPLRGPGQVREGAELDVAARPRIAPHRGVVHAGKVRGQVDLLEWHGQWLRTQLPSRRRSGWRAGRARAARAGCRPRSRCGTRRAAAVRAPGSLVIASRSSGMAPGRSRNPDSPACLPVLQQVGELRGRAGEDGRVARVRIARAARPAGPCGWRPRSTARPRNTTRSPKTWTASSRAAGGSAGGADLGHDRRGRAPASRGVT